jgi:small neutral amino acid transporter SnatA (MarC family)
MQEQLQAIVTVLSLVNPLVCGAMFARVEAERSTHERRVDATKVALAIVIILTAAALIGTQLLHLFGVSLDAFMVAGGGVLAWMGFSMLSGQASSSSSNAASAQGASLTPLILFAASPGTITGVITLSAAHTRLGFPVTDQSLVWDVVGFDGVVGHRVRVHQREQPARKRLKYEEDAERDDHQQIAREPSAPRHSSEDLREHRALLP